MKIVVEGCAHGALDKIYESILYLQQKENITIDLLICCGDFQAVRNSYDLDCMAVPKKYREMGDFYKYYSGQAVAPIPTIWIHGNHEAGNYLQELYLGGWVAPNIYYLGFSNVIEFGGIKIGGISGIFKENHYRKGYSEQIPYDSNSIRSVYHVREFEVFKLQHYTQRIDIFLSHDWPRGIYKFGDTMQLLQKKPFFAQEIEANTLGSPANEELLLTLAPKYWFAAHLHVKFAAVVDHPDKTDSSGAPVRTKFLALDKCLPHRDFLQVVDIPSDPNAPKKFKYDEEWLAIVKASMPYYSTSKHYVTLPRKLDLAPARDYIRKLAGSDPSVLYVPTDFVQTVPAYPNDRVQYEKLGPFMDPQTIRLLKLLDVNIPSVVPQTIPAHETPDSPAQQQSTSQQL